MVPFTAGVERLDVEGASPALDEEMRQSFSSGRRYVFISWAVLLLAALIGVVQPGVPEKDEAGAISETAAVSH